MTRELAISILVGETIGTTEQTRKAVKMAIDALMADVPDTNVGKWIPCSERLPEDGVWTLCTFTDGHIGTAYYCEIYGEWLGYTKDAIAWMPLPEEYKE